MTSHCPLNPAANGPAWPWNWLIQAPPSPCPLPATGLHGLSPLSWWAAGHYEGNLRRVLLTLRKDPRPQQMAALLDGLVHRLQPIQQAPLLIPIPSWKRKANPLPLLLAHQLMRRLGWPCHPNLLERRHPVLGQHRLDRELRWQNQQGAFGCPQRPRHPSLPRGVRTVMLLDDILTTGATACAAAAALEAMGWQVLGLACLGRTPSQRRPIRQAQGAEGREGSSCDLRSSRRDSGEPG